MLNHTEYLLTKLAEECAEVAQRATKALTFGIDEVQPGQPHTNAERLVHELADLAAVVGMMQDYNAIAVNLHEFRQAVERKRLKLDWYMEYSRQQGCLG